MCTNVIDEHGNTCGDEGRRCERCIEHAAREHSYLRGASRFSAMGDEIGRAEYEQELRDAGRGHLVAP